MGIREAVESVKEGITGWRDPAAQWQKTKEGAATLVKSNNGAAAQAGDALASRKSRIDAAVDGTNDPTSVEYGGHRGSSTGQ